MSFTNTAHSLKALLVEQKTPFVVSTTKSLIESTEALRLVYKQYLARGYCSENTHALHLPLHSTLPDTTIFTVKFGHTIVATASLIIDSPFGLPMESTFSNLISDRRKSNLKLGEVSMLAVNSDSLELKGVALDNDQKLAILNALWQSLYKMVTTNKVQQLFLTTHPKHEKLYSHFGFKSTGTVRSYGKANGNPALPMCQTVQNQLSPRNPVNDIAGCPVEYIPLSFNNYEAWRFDLIHLFMQNSNQCERDFWHNLTTVQKSYLKFHFPSISLKYDNNS